MSSASDFSGLDLLLQKSGQTIKSKNDLAVAFVHYAMIQSGFKCDSSDETSDNNAESVLLPPNWSGTNSTGGELKYVRNGVQYTLKNQITDNFMKFNLSDDRNSVAANIEMNLDDIRDIKGPLGQCLPGYEYLMARFKEDLISPFRMDSSGSHATTGTTTEEPKLQPTTDPSLAFETPPPLDRRIGGVGHRDLDPLARDRGGMILDPFNQRPGRWDSDLGIPGPRLPRPPPGARYDPFGPPDNRIRPKKPLPDPDDDDSHI